MSEQTDDDKLKNWKTVLNRTEPLLSERYTLFSFLMVCVRQHFEKRWHILEEHSDSAGKIYHSQVKPAILK
jgi:hypothetical protein